MTPSFPTILFALLLVFLPEAHAQPAKDAAIEAVFERLRNGHKTFDELTEHNTCTNIMALPKIRPAPSFAGEPLWMRSVGMEVGFVEATPYTGHTARVRVQPTRAVAPNTHIRVQLTGPDFTLTEIIEMPEGEPNPVDLSIQKLPSEGQYLMVLESLVEGTPNQTWSQQYRHFDVSSHPLSTQVLLPKGFHETHRFLDTDPNSPSSEALVTCGTQKDQKVCVRTTAVLQDCKSQRDRPPTSIDASTKHPVAHWCSDDRLLTLYSNRKKNQQEAIEDLQWLFPRDAQP